MWALRRYRQLQRMLTCLHITWLSDQTVFLLPLAQVDPHTSLFCLATMRAPLAAEVMWKVKQRGNTFFNTFVFRKHLSQMSPLLSDLWKAVEWVSPRVQGRRAAFRRGIGQIWKHLLSLKTGFNYSSAAYAVVELCMCVLMDEFVRLISSTFSLEFKSTYTTALSNR